MQREELDNIKQMDPNAPSQSLPAARQSTAEAAPVAEVLDLLRIGYVAVQDAAAHDLAPKLLGPDLPVRAEERFVHRVSQLVLFGGCPLESRVDPQLPNPLSPVPGEGFTPPLPPRLEAPPKVL